MDTKIRNAIVATSVLWTAADEAIMLYVFLMISCHFIITLDLVLRRMFRKNLYSPAILRNFRR